MAQHGAIPGGSASMASVALLNIVAQGDLPPTRVNLGPFPGPWQPSQPSPTQAGAVEVRSRRLSSRLPPAAALPPP
eukprot:582034-Prymnesium_polylepis.1